MWSPLQPHEGAREPAVLRIDLLCLPAFLVAQAHSCPQTPGPLQLVVTGSLLTAFHGHCSQDPSELSLFKLVTSPCVVPVFVF